MKPLPPDLHLFREAMADAIPLPPDNRAHITPPKPRLQKPRASEPRQSADNGLTDRPDDDNAPQFARAGISRQTQRELRRGRWPIQSELDLHGATREEARRALVEFLEECRTHDLRVVRVIHGRGLSSPDGMGILRPLVRGWLIQRAEVLAYCQARPQDGGEGALLVLLKARTEPREA